MSKNFLKPLVPLLIPMTIQKELGKLKDPKKAQNLSRFFKTGKGQYGEGDVFLGLTVPQVRQVAKNYPDLSFGELQKLLSSKIHEYRLTALLILIIKYRRADDGEKKKIFEFYLKNAPHINNWDLVDLSAPNIIGDYLLKNDRSILYRLANSQNLWEKRIAVLSTFAFIKKGEFNESLKISEMLLDDKHDLIHKAVGWMLREVGKKDREAEEKFLEKYCKVMPRTMLRYAIEKFDEEKRKYYLNRPH